MPGPNGTEKRSVGRGIEVEAGERTRRTSELIEDKLENQNNTKLLIPYLIHLIEEKGGRGQGRGDHIWRIRSAGKNAGDIGFLAILAHS